MSDREYKERVRNGYIVVGMIVLFVIGLFSKRVDFIFTLLVSGWIVWIFARDGIAKLTNKVERLKGEHGSINSLPLADRPDIKPASQPNTKVAVAVTAGEIETPAIAVSADKKWFQQLVRNAVHILIIGETNSGKSTAAKAILKARASSGEQIIILDPHARPSTWNGLSAIGRGRDYPAIENMISILQAEMDNRYKLYAEDDNYNPVRLNIFVDEVPSIATYCESWQAFFTVLSCEARKVNMSLICLSQSRLVDMLGIKGRSDVRENFTEILLGEKAIRAVPETIKQTRPAAVDYNGKLQAVDTSMLPALGNGEISMGVLWVPDVNLTPQKPAQTATGPLEQGITTAPLSEDEMVRLNDWEDEGLSRREMARRLYRDRGGKNTTFEGTGPVFQIVKRYLDNNP